MPGGWKSSVLAASRPASLRKISLISKTPGTAASRKPSPKAGLVERSGQGLNLMIENAIKHTKPLPDFSGTASHEVRLTMAGTVQNPAFIRYLQRLGDERLARFSTQDYMALDTIQREAPLLPALLERLPALIHTGAVETIGRGKSARHFLSREMYEAIGEPGTYTRHKGLDQETNKALLLKHIEEHASTGSPLSHLRQVLPALSDREIQWLLNQLRTEGKIAVESKRRWSLWWPACRKID